MRVSESVSFFLQECCEHHGSVLFASPLPDTSADRWDNPQSSFYHQLDRGGCNRRWQSPPMKAKDMETGRRMAALRSSLYETTPLHSNTWIASLEPSLSRQRRCRDPVVPWLCRSGHQLPFCQADALSSCVDEGAGAHVRDPLPYIFARLSAGGADVLLWIALCFANQTSAISGSTSWQLSRLLGASTLAVLPRVPTHSAFSQLFDRLDAFEVLHRSSSVATSAIIYNNIVRWPLIYEVGCAMRPLTCRGEVTDQNLYPSWRLHLVCGRILRVTRN